MALPEPPFVDFLKEPPKPGDADYDPEVHKVQGWFYRHERRVREQVIAIEEFRELSDQIEQCVLNNGVNSYQVCRPLLLEYRKRTSEWRNLIPPVGEETSSVVDPVWFQEGCHQRDWSTP